MLTRRALASFLLVPALKSQETAELLPELHLTEAERRQIAKDVESALRQARWLLELDLDGVAPGFLFLPRR
jgi:hypothetical protein